MIHVLKVSFIGLFVASAAFAASNDACTDFSGRWKGSCFGTSMAFFMKQDGCKGFSILDGNQYVEFGKIFQFPELSPVAGNMMAVDLSLDGSSLHVVGVGIAPNREGKHDIHASDFDMRITEEKLLISGTADGKPMICTLQR